MAQKKKKKPAKQAPAKINPEKYIREHARKLPIHECLMGDEAEIKVINISRKRANGNLILGVFLVDTLCLGIKNAGWQFDLTPEKYQDFLNNQSVSINMRPCSMQLALNIIYGAVEYAESLGFKPHKSYQISQYILDEEVEYLAVEFGKNGRPFFINGPFDHVNSILNTLNRTVGQGNYDFIHMNGMDDDGLYLNDIIDFDDDDDDDDDDEVETEYQDVTSKN